MNFLEHYWGLFLFLAIVFDALALINQLKRMKRMFRGVADVSLRGDLVAGIEDTASGFFSGLIQLVFYAMIGGVSTILFIIGVVLAIIHASR